MGTVVLALNCKFDPALFLCSILFHLLYGGFFVRCTTRIFWLGSKWQVEKVNILDVPIMATSVQTVDSARDLGVVVDSHLTMTTHVSAVCHAAYYQLWQ